MRLWVRVRKFLTPFSSIFQIYRGNVLSVKETREPGKNHQPVPSHGQTLPRKDASITPHPNWIRTHNISGDRH